MLAIHRCLRRQHFLAGNLGERLLGHQLKCKLNSIAFNGCIAFEQPAEMLNTVEAHHPTTKLLGGDRTRFHEAIRKRFFAFAMCEIHRPTLEVDQRLRRRRGDRQLAGDLCTAGFLDHFPRSPQRRLFRGEFVLTRHAHCWTPWLINSYSLDCSNATRTSAITSRPEAGSTN